MVSKLEDLIAWISKNKLFGAALIIIVDAVAQMEASTNASATEWIPKNPPKVLFQRILLYFLFLVE